MNLLQFTVNKAYLSKIYKDRNIKHLFKSDILCLRLFFVPLRYFFRLCFILLNSCLIVKTFFCCKGNWSWHYKRVIIIKKKHLLSIKSGMEIFYIKKSFFPSNILLLSSFCLQWFFSLLNYDIINYNIIYYKFFFFLNPFDTVEVLSSLTWYNIKIIPHTHIPSTLLERWPHHCVDFFYVCLFI